MIERTYGRVYNIQKTIIVNGILVSRWKLLEYNDTIHNAYIILPRRWKQKVSGAREISRIYI